MDSEEGNTFLKLDEQVELESTENPVRLRQSKTLLEENNESCDVEKLKSLINKNLFGCDLAVCVFIAALKSFKADQCLRPFPPCFLNENNEKDFVALVSL